MLHAMACSGLISCSPTLCDIGFPKAQLPTAMEKSASTPVFNTFGKDEAYFLRQAKAKVIASLPPRRPEDASIGGTISLDHPDLNPHFKSTYYKTLNTVYYITTMDAHASPAIEKVVNPDGTFFIYFKLCRDPHQGMKEWPFLEPCVPLIYKGIATGDGWEHVFQELVQKCIECEGWSLRLVLEPYGKGWHFTIPAESQAGVFIHYCLSSLIVNGLVDSKSYEGRALHVCWVTNLLSRQLAAVDFEDIDPVPFQLVTQSISDLCPDFE